jgi:hypothetical protein
MLTPLSSEKCRVVRKKEVIKCSMCGQIMDFVGVTRLGYDEEDDLQGSC